MTKITELKRKKEDHPRLNRDRKYDIERSKHSELKKVNILHYALLAYPHTIVPVTQDEVMRIISSKRIDTYTFSTSFEGRRNAVILIFMLIEEVAGKAF